MKKHLTLSLFVIFAGFLTACNNPSDCCPGYSLNIEVELQNTDGADLLNPATAGYFKKQDIDVYYEIKGKLETYASLNKGTTLDNPAGLDIMTDGTKYFLQVFSNPTAGDEVVTLIRIEGRPEIRLVAKVEGENGKQITELRYNDQLAWSNATSQTAPRVTVAVE